MAMEWTSMNAYPIRGDTADADLQLPQRAVGIWYHLVSNIKALRHQKAGCDLVIAEYDDFW